MRQAVYMYQPLAKSAMQASDQVISHSTLLHNRAYSIKDNNTRTVSNIEMMVAKEWMEAVNKILLLHRPAVNLAYNQQALQSPMRDKTTAWQ
jgi:hypothetical protein